MLLLKKLPIIQKAQILDYNHIQPLSAYHKICLSTIIPHGSTDAWIFSTNKYMINYASSCAFFLFQPTYLKFIFLSLYSLFHIKNDIGGAIVYKILYSLGIHLSWVYFPTWALTYLAWIHTPLHYMRVIPLLTKFQIFTLLMTHAFVYLILSKRDINDITLGGSWVPLAIGHIMTNS